MLILVVLLYILAGFDAWLTRKRMNEYGVWVELNKLTTFLANRISIEAGILLSVLVPTTIIALVCIKFGWTIPLALLIGFRARLFVTQIQSIVFESKIKQFKRGLDKEATLPSSESSDSLTPPISTEEDNARKPK